MTDPIPATPTGQAAPRGLVVVATLAAAWAAWWLMMASHEAGHILAGLLTGGRIDRIDLSPLSFSQTQLARSPHPAIVVWAGPLFGVADAIAAWLLARYWARRDEAMLHALPAVTFLAGFCLLANGLYIGLGWIDRIGDTADMLRTGTPVAVMVVFGVACTGSGLMLWHRLGAWLGMKRITAIEARALLTISAVLIALGFMVDACLNALGL